MNAIAKFKEFVWNCYLSIRYVVLRIYYNRHMPKILNSEDTLKRIIEENISISRYGDGEIKVLLGGSIGFCNNNADISNRLEQILSQPKANLLVCIPIMIRTQKGITKKAKKFWKQHFAVEYPNWFKYLNKKMTYGDSFCSRFYIGIQDFEKAAKIVDLWKKIWNNKVCIIVEGANTRMGMGNNLLDNAKDIKRILCPPTDAFSKYDEIFKAVTQTVRDLHEDYIVLIALGPTATVLAYDLCKEGIQSIDCGHLDIEYEWYLQKTTVRTDIPTKAVNEFWDGGLNVSNDVSDSYINQIICKIEYT